MSILGFIYDLGALVPLVRIEDVELNLGYRLRGIRRYRQSIMQ